MVKIPKKLVHNLTQEKIKENKAIEAENNAKKL